MRVVNTAVQMNPTILDATPRSIFNAAMKAATDGLLPDGREGAIVPYNMKIKGKNGAKDAWVVEVQWMPMIAGLRKKVRNSGEIATWDAQVVYERDDFDYALGDEPYLHHKPFLGFDRGKIIAAYSVATLKSGEKSREVMSIGEINAIRARSKSSEKGPWVTDFAEMCRKTVARRHSKVLPMSTDLDDLIRQDDALYDFEGQNDGDTRIVLPAGRQMPLNDRLSALANPAHDEDGVILDHEPSDGGDPSETAGGPADGTSQEDADQRGDDAGQPTASSPDAATPAQIDNDAAVAKAREAGAAAFRGGTAKRKCPPQLRDDGREDEFAAWQEGWMEEAAKAGAASGK